MLDIIFVIDKLQGWWLWVSIIKIARNIFNLKIRDGLEKKILYDLSYDLTSHDCFASLINNVYNVSNKNIQCWSSPPECNAHWGDPSLSSWQSHSVVDGPVNASDKGSRAGAHWAPALEPRPLSPGQAWAANPVKHELLDRVRVCCILDTAMWDSKSFVIIVHNGYWCTTCKNKHQISCET